MTSVVELIIRQYDFNLLYAKALVADIAEDQMTIVPSEGLLNHPAFTLGHLVTGSAMVAEDIGGEKLLPHGWADLFERKGPNDQTRPDTDKTKYPLKVHLIGELENQHEKVKEQLLRISETALQREVKWRFGHYMPTMLDVVVFMCINHEAMHLGQLAAWRRAMGLPAALRTL